MHKPLTSQQSQPQYLWLLMLSFTMIVVLSSWFAPKLIIVYGLVLDAGTLIFPLSFVLANVITEVYGYKKIRLAIWVGLLFHIFFMLYGQLIILLPSPSEYQYSSLFNQLYGMTVRLIIASTISYFICEYLNAYILARLKLLFRGKHIALRFLSSTFVAAGLDSLIFGLIAFYGLLSQDQLINMILTMWFIKVLVEILLLPVSVKLAQYLKCIEHSDIYDTDTQFNPFSLESRYIQENNRYTNK